MVTISPSCNLASSNYLNSRASIHTSGLSEKKTMDMVCTAVANLLIKSVSVRAPPYSSLSAHMLHICCHISCLTDVHLFQNHIDASLHRYTFPCTLMLH